MSRQDRPLKPTLEPGVLSATAAIEWRCRQANQPMPQLPRDAILTHQPSLLGRDRPWRRDRSFGCLSFDVRLVAANGNNVALVACRGVGAAVTAVAIEEMAVVGVRRLLAIDVAGSLDPSVRSGDIVVLDGAIAGDGTSPHYTAESLAPPNDALTGAVALRLAENTVPHSRGLAWSTDAVYRETRREIDVARGRGAVVVDMESAAVFAAAAALGIEAAAVLVVADELFDGWQPPAGMAKVQSQLKRLVSTLAPALLS